MRAKEWGRRRVLLAGAALSLAGLRPAQAAPRRIGVLTPADTQWQPEPFLEELAALGLKAGDSLALEVRSAAGDLRRLPELASGLVAAGVELIVGVNTPGARAAIAASADIPVIVMVVADPVLLGFVSNLANPGGRITGVANMANDVAQKRLEVLKEALPAARRIACVYHPDEPIARWEMNGLQEVAPRFGVELRFLPMRTLDELERAMAEAADWPAHAALRVVGQALTHASEMAALALRHKLPSMALTADGVRLGSLLSYFADHAALWRRGAHQVARILRGEPPGSIPFERPTKFELAVNLRTARALGLQLPEAILLRADVAIE